MLFDNHPELRHKLSLTLVSLFFTNLIGWNIYIYNKILSNERALFNQKTWITEEFAKKSTIKRLETKIDNKFEAMTQRFDDINKRLDFIILLNKGKKEP
ncbi:hypothetical protein [Spartinivicinus ruber]|uniref:hypothetical protein n=1 Tax=Spartinivicinus ruber TaxID=2683272 RepID=UPI0013D278D2|nr:hypothetical protein [Spartinivicinus ruber]